MGEELGCVVRAFCGRATEDVLFGCFIGRYGRCIVWMFYRNEFRNLLSVFLCLIFTMDFVDV
jgi:hypothetical protein